MSDDVKRWLRSAVGDEPPLRLDRDAVFRDGRRKLRNRKLFQAGGAVTGVVAVVVGAMLVTGLGTTDEPSIPPAATSTTGEPPVETSPEASLPPSSAAQPSSDEVAVRLTAALYKPGLLPFELRPLPGADGTPMFRQVHKEVYLFEADVRGGKADGWLSLLVEHPSAGKGMDATCSVPEVSFVDCAVRLEHDMPMTVGVEKRAGGEVRRWVRSVRPDGAFVTAVSSNLSAHDRADGVPPSQAKPPVSEQTLIALAANPELALY